MKQTSRRLDLRRAGIVAALVAVLALGLAACYPGGPENLGEIAVVVTIKNPQGDFNGMMTYAMQDTVVELEKPGDSSSEPIDTKFNDGILDELQIQMANAGFDRIDNPDEVANKPDVWLSVGAVESETWVYYYSWPYYGYPGWGYYYPPYVSGASFQQGTVIWQLHDLRGIENPSNPEARPPLNWIGALNGAIQKSTTEANIRNGIKQAFAQSPYIAAQSAGK